MRILFACLLLGHALLHLLGPAKAFGWAELSQLTRDISRPLGVLWLLAALALLASLGSFFLAPRAFPWLGLGALLLSQVVICTSWSDARFGTLANVLLLFAVILGMARGGPPSFAALYARQVATRSEPGPLPPPLRESDIAALPPPVQRYIRESGALGQPQVRSMRVRFSGRIRSGPQADWMPFTAEQTSFFAEPARLFLLSATRGGVPADVLHVFAAGQASMRGRIAGLIPFLDAHGDEMTRAETVTLLNDMVVMAPATLIDPRLRFTAIDAQHTAVEFTLGKNTVRATLVFGAGGELADFVSDDRLAASPDGKTFQRLRWSTPLSQVGWLGPARGGQPGTTHIAASAEALWHEPAGPYAYGQFQLLSVEYNREVTGQR